MTEEISIDRIEVHQGMNKIIGEKFMEAIQEHAKILGDRTAEDNTEVTIGMKITVEKDVGVGLGKGHFHEITIIIEAMIEA